jgi:2-polyprenyl-3-methyl-5-hydroxy-6-metoxy-1,4-benzoquinol methylase
MNNFISCYVCYSPLKSIVFKAIDYNDNSAPYAFYQCTYCEIIQIYPFPKDEENTKYYSYTDPDEYAKGKNKQIKFISKIPFGSLLLRKYIDGCYQKRYERVLTLCKKGKILDIGCGEGSFLKKFPPEKWQRSGIEINKNLAKFAKTHTKNATIITKPIESARFPKKNFDILTLWHVLEHIHNPKIVLKSLRKLISPNGYLVIEVPNGNSIYRKFFKSNWQLLLLPQHLFFWTKKSLIYALNDAGFEVIHTSYPGILNLSGASSCANFLQGKGFNQVFAIISAILFSPFCILMNIFFFNKRDNIVVIAKPA